MNYDSDVLLLSSNLSIGESLRTECPICRGGTSREQSLSVTKDDKGVVWQCFRAKCNYKGASNVSVLSEDIAHRPKPKVLWEGKTHDIPAKVADRIRSLWHFEVIPEGWYWTTDYGGRVCMSVYGPTGRHRGWVLRSISSASTGRTKALTFINEGEEGISWYKTTPGAPTILVEDIPSAVRAAEYLNSVALLGTGIGTDRAVEIADTATRPVVLALDQDATSLAFKWARKYSLLWEDVEVLPLTKDIKNMTEQELQELLT